MPAQAHGRVELGDGGRDAVAIGPVAVDVERELGMPGRRPRDSPHGVVDALAGGERGEHDAGADRGWILLARGGELAAVADHHDVVANAGEPLDVCLLAPGEQHDGVVAPEVLEHRTAARLQARALRVLFG